MIKNFLILFLVSFFFLVLPVHSSPNDTGAIEFEDSKFEILIRNGLKVVPLDGFTIRSPTVAFC